MVRKLTKLLIRAFLCPVCPSLWCFAWAYVIRNVFLERLKYGNGISCEGTRWFGRSVYLALFISQCQRHKGYISRTSGPHSAVSLRWAGLSAPFSNPSCLVVFIQRALGSHSTGLLPVSSSPPALELLLPAPVYSAWLSKPHLYKLTQQLIREKNEQFSRVKMSAQAAVMFLAHSGTRNVPHGQMSKLGWLSGMQWVQMPTRCHYFSAKGHV